MVYHPIIDSVAVALICVLTIGFTRSSSLHRIVSLIVSSILTWHCLVSCPVYIHRNSWATSVGGYTLSALFHYLDVGVLSGWAYDLQGPARDLSSSSQQRPARPKETGTRASGVPADHDHIHIILSRLKFGAWVFTSWRFVNTPYQVRNIPPLKDYLRQDRIAFLLHTGVTFMACYLILDGLHASQDPALAAKFFSVDKTGLFSRFDQVTAEEFVMRFFTAVALGASLVSVQRGVYCLMAFVCVLFKASDPSEWPPFNGSVLEIYCLRTFWRYALPETISTIPFQVDYLARLNDSPSSFWHQINTHRLLVGANFLLYNVLRVPPSWKGSVPLRYTRACLVFLISGLLHVAIDVSAGIPPAKSGALGFFMMQPIGMAIEDVVSCWFQPLQQLLHLPGSAQRSLGAIWVGLWMAWTAPWYLYPVLERNGSDDAGVVPVSFFANARQLLK